MILWSTERRANRFEELGMNFQGSWSITCYYLAELQDGNAIWVVGKGHD